MARFDLILRGGTVPTAGSGGPVDVAIADGVVGALGPELEGAAAEEVDAAGLLVLPGAVDAHVHLNEPGRTEWEGWATGTAGAVAGGTTTVVDMPLNSTPPTVDAAAFDAKLAAARAASHADFALWGGLVPGNVGRLAELAGRGVVGLKAFMSDSGIEDFAAADDLTLAEGMAEAARLGLPVAVHAESDAITAGLARRARAEGRTAMCDFLASRPALAEVEAIGRALLLAEETGCRLHVVHVSTGRGVALVAEARARGVDATCETCPHYLCLTAEDAERLGAVAKCAPPLRGPDEVEALWRALATGGVAFVASDHSPSPPALKAGDAFAAWGGIAGVQTLLPLVLGDGLRRGLPPARLAEVLAAAPARRFALVGKGSLDIGDDADLAVVEPGGPWPLRPEDLRHRHPLSPFAGRPLHARVRRTVLRGATVAVDGRPKGPPQGRLVTPTRDREVASVP